jgi:hypothetical protein
MFNLKSREKKKVYNFVDKNYTKKIDVIVSNKHMPLYNSACHYNADAICEAGNAVAVVECFILDNEKHDATLHYINMNENMELFDATLGYRWSGCDYRFSKIISRSPNIDPSDILIKKKEEIIKKSGVSDIAKKIIGIHKLI